MAKATGLCILCGEFPCECTKPKKSRKVTTAILPPQGFRGQETVSSAVVPPRPHEPPAPPPVAAGRAPFSRDDAVMVAALQALVPLLGDDEKKRLQEYLSVQLTAKERAVVWQAQAL